jgi:hypothetical protein
MTRKLTPREHRRGFLSVSTVHEVHNIAAEGPIYSQPEGQKAGSYCKIFGGDISFMHQSAIFFLSAQLGSTALQTAS